MTTDNQHASDLSRPPKVRITYDVESGGAIAKEELPFIVGILADLSGNREDTDAFSPLKNRRMIDIDRDNFNDVLKTVAPRVDLLPMLTAVPELQASADPNDKAIVFHSLDDFTPLRVAQALPALRTQLDARNRLRATATSGGHDDLDGQIAAIDRQLSVALSAILQSPNFQAVERTWRGLFWLAARTETGPLLRLRVFDATKEELRRDLEKAVEFDQSALFKLIYEAEYGTYGGLPYSLLVGDYEIDGGDADVGFLKKMAEVAAAAHAPFITAASSKLFGLADYSDLAKPRALEKIFESQELTAFREFREMEDARYVSLVLPRVLLRLPYGRPEKRTTVVCDGLAFEEALNDCASPMLDGDGKLLGYPAPDQARLLWGNAAYVLAERITHAFAVHGWPAAIRGVERGGLVEGLPVYAYARDAVTTEQLCPTEIAISDRRERELRELGFIALCHCKDTDKATFFNSPSAHAPQKYLSDDANEAARMAATLPYLLAASRFAHYLKVIMREKLGTFLTRGNVESFLNNWIAQYVLLDEDATPAANAAFPLRAASVVVSDIAGEPGSYRATVFLKPHFQLAELTTSMRLVVDLPM